MYADGEPWKFGAVVNSSVAGVFIFSLLGVFLGLTALGIGLAWLMVPEPPEYLRNSYLEMPKPQGWSCSIEVTEWVCRHGGELSRKGIIIMTAKVRNESDTRALYTQHLLQPRIVATSDGDQLESEVIYVRDVLLGNYLWVDGLHYQSEIPNYFTRYMATITSEIGVLVTFSAHKTVYEELKQEFEESISSMAVHQSKSLLNN